MSLACRVLGHRFRFERDGPSIVWRCERGCGVGGERVYADTAEADRYLAQLRRGSPGPPTALLRAMSGVLPRDRSS